MAQDIKHYGEEVKIKHHQEWKTAMTEELDTLKANDVQTIVVPPKDAHVLHNEWVYKPTTDAYGDIERYKARLVVCGNKQVFGIDYNLTSAAVMDLSTVKIILMLSRRWKVPARHIDVPNACVKAEKEEHLDIYISMPKRMIMDEEELKSLGTKSTYSLALLLKSRYTDSSRLEDSGASCLILSFDRVVLDCA
uniref:Reverse transcriptase Ty1/copia-type domain-containing protein n=1 Tax=Peronospora matthiolae TaxID=2874970 RepID=A0AAV1TEM5_9STRA